MPPTVALSLCYLLCIFLRVGTNTLHPEDKLVALSLKPPGCVVGLECTFDVKIHGLVSNVEYGILLLVAKDDGSYIHGIETPLVVVSDVN